MSNPLYFYRCKNCLTVAVAAAKARYDQPWHCNSCHWPMSFLYERQPDNDAERALVRRGIVWNPGVCKEPTRG